MNQWISRLCWKKVKMSINRTKGRLAWMDVMDWFGVGLGLVGTERLISILSSMDITDITEVGKS